MPQGESLFGLCIHPSLKYVVDVLVSAITLQCEEGKEISDSLGEGN